MGLAALVLASASLAGYVAWTLPRRDGVLQMPGLAGPVRIERDEHGIPTIHAGTLDDAAYAMGVLHVQDRGWQLETHRRIVAGRLAEAFGASALGTDRFVRALGVRRAAQTQWASLSPGSKALVTAYAAGVNQAWQRLGQGLPPEFLLLGVRPEPWQPEDTLAWSTMMAWDLGGNWSSELLRLRLAMQLPQSRIDELLPPYPGDAAPRGPDYPAWIRSVGLQRRTVTAWAELPTLAPESGIEGIGSNNWVVAGSRTTSGTPLLANDPHLKLTAPSLWYLVRLQLPGQRIAGVTMPGVPAVILGQNDDIAWGATNTGPDVQDLYLEEVRQDDPSRYRTPQGWASFEQEPQRIAVRGGPDVPFVTRRTRHGPVISDAGVSDDVLGPREGQRHVLAMRWTALEADQDMLSAAVGMMTARSVDAFVAASRTWTAPMQNFVVADRAGRIGFVAAGRVPLRHPDNDLAGRAPAPGWDARYDWTGWLAADETPREFDPVRGWIATANQRIHGPSYPHRLGSDWTLPFRQQRIEALLESRPRHSLQDLVAMQLDEQSPATRRLLPWLRKARSDHPAFAKVQPMLQRFDAGMAGEDAAPLVYWAWLRHLGELVLADDLGDALWSQTLGRTWFDALEGILDRDDAHWCDDQRTPDVRERCSDRVDHALTLALQELQSRHGDDPGRWQWSRAHPARSEHRPFSHVGLLAPLFELRVPVGGDTYTVNASRVNLKPLPRTGELYVSEHGPSLRAVYDVARPEQSRVMHSSGQSGLPFSPWYRQFAQPWARGETVPLWQAPAVHTLELRP